MKSLIEIFKDQSNTTDKLTTHSYVHFYEIYFAHLRNQVESVLEIGIGEGGSLRAWRDYFSHATIYGIDNHLPFVDRMQLEDRIRPYYLDVTSEVDLWEWARDKKFDIIIDDGSHKTKDIQESYYTLWPFLNGGGSYIIEDAGQASDRLELLDYFSFFIEGTILNRHPARAIIFRPNMIILEKKMVNDMTVPPLDRL